MFGSAVRTLLKLILAVVVLTIIFTLPPIRTGIQYHAYSVCPTPSDCPILTKYISWYQIVGGLIYTGISNGGLSKSLILSTGLRNSHVQSLDANWGYEQGVGFGMLLPHLEYNTIPMYFSNEAFNSIVRDPNLTRNPQGLVGLTNLSSCPAKFLPRSVRDGNSLLYVILLYIPAPHP